MTRAAPSEYARRSPMPRLTLPTALLAPLSGYCALVACGAFARRLLCESTLPTIAVWGLAALLLGALALWRRPNRESTPACVNLTAPSLERRHELVCLALLAAATLFFAFARRSAVPHFRHDEAIEIQFPANLVRTGQFAFPVGEELHPELWLCSTGPLVLLPAAALFHLLGVTVEVARLVPGFFLVLAAYAVWRFARRLAGARGAVLAVVVFLSSAEIVNTARMLLGDYAALAFFLLGADQWLGALEAGERRDRRRRSLTAGLLLGAMLLAKPVYALAAFGFLCFLLWDRASDRRVHLEQVLIPALLVLAMVLPWEFWRVRHGTLVLLGNQVPGFPASYLTFDLGRALPKLKEALQRPELWLAPVGLLWNLKQSAAARRASLLLAATAGLSLLWWLTFVIILDRYLIFPQAAAGLLGAALLATALERVSAAREPFERLLALAVLLVFLALPLLRLASNGEKVLRAPGGPWPEQKFADALRRHLPAGATIALSRVPLEYLFFDPRPHRVVTLSEASTLPSGSFYLLIDSAEPTPAGFAELTRIGRYRLLQRGP